MKKNEIKNCTPHALNIVNADGKTVTIQPCGIVPRCSQNETEVGVIEGITVTKQEFGEVVDLPEPQDCVFLVVSRLVASACLDRRDLLIPGPLLRDESGKVIGCKGLSVVR